MINNHTINFPYSNADMQLKVDYTGGVYPVYIGYARPGALVSAPEWQICKITYDANNNVTARTFAGGANDYTSVWNDRATLTYS